MRVGTTFGRSEVADPLVLATRVKEIEGYHHGLAQVRLPRACHEGEGDCLAGIAAESRQLVLPARQAGRGLSRRAMTLIELLVVLTIIMLLAAATIPRLKPEVERSRVREAARAIQLYLSSARNQAMATGRPCGVMIERLAAENGCSMHLVQVETPPLYSGDTDNATATVTSTTGPIRGYSYCAISPQSGAQCAALSGRPGADRLPRLLDHPGHPEPGQRHNRRDHQYIQAHRLRRCHARREHALEQPDDHRPVRDHGAGHRSRRPPRCSSPRRPAST